ncbi:T9SS type A sorting domain-containing protein [Parabacteroides sp. FAFU027]|uniref:T9SS type A sorting domain-containing protein n=1 Tax=Parabacteroides sp. FAFU027 TaxID=2922715 RepID=UPI001FAEB00C|nr:T9SS type A sorting domain-containing protein [Parabacteroides sp. FAFU027]
MSLSLSPNPATDEVKIIFSLRNSGKAQIELCNPSGTVLYKAEKQYDYAGLQKETISLNKLNLPQSIYIIRVSADGMQGITKLIRGKMLI